MKTSNGLWFGVSIQTNGTSDMFLEILQERLHGEGRLRNQSEMKHTRILFVISRNISQIKYYSFLCLLTKQIEPCDLLFQERMLSTKEVVFL